MTPTRPLAGPGNGKGAKGSNISNPSRHGTPAPSATDHIGISEQGRAAHMLLHTCCCTHAAAHMLLHTCRLAEGPRSFLFATAS